MSQKTVVVDPDHWRCVDVFRGERCSKMGTISPSTNGSGPWFCSDHYPAFRGMVAKGTPPPGGFRALRSLLPRAPDPEAAAERAAIQAE